MPGMRWSLITSATGSRAITASASRPRARDQHRVIVGERAPDRALAGRLVIDGEQRVHGSCGWRSARRSQAAIVSMAARLPPMPRPLWPHHAAGLARQPSAGSAALGRVARCAHRRGG
jgi:hypothetical protein